MRKFFSEIVGHTIWFDPSEVVAVEPYLKYQNGEIYCIDVHLKSGLTLSIYREIARPGVDMELIGSLASKFVDLLGDKFGIFLPVKPEGEIEVRRVTN